MPFIYCPSSCWRKTQTNLLCSQPKTWILQICFCLFLQVMNNLLCRSEHHKVGVPCICSLHSDRSGTLGLVFHSSIPDLETPTDIIPNLWAGKRVEYVAEHLAQFTGEGRAGSRLTKQWGPLNTFEWPQLYPGPSES